MGVHLGEFVKLADPFGRHSRSELIAIIEETTRLIDEDSDNLGAKWMRGVANRRLGELLSAKGDFESVIRVSGTLQALAWMARGECRIAMGRAREGHNDIGEANKLTQRRTDARVYLYRAIVQCEEGRFSMAQMELNKALRTGGVDADAHRLQALVLISLPRSPVTLKAALENANRACEITKSKDWLSLEALAMVQAVCEDFAAASASAERAAALATDENKERCESLLKRCREKLPVETDWNNLLGFDSRKKTK
jgi:tetratricopeptide (TPR) repeat protein